MPGWAYDDGDPRLPAAFSWLPASCAQRIGWSVIETGHGTELRVSCDESILPGSNRVVQRGAFCDPTTGAVQGTTIGCSSAELSCDAFDRTCQLACATDADCVNGGLAGFICDRRIAREYFPNGVPSGVVPNAIHGVCVDWNCGR